jgi:hypothetical protein
MGETFGDARTYLHEQGITGLHEQDITGREIIGARDEYGRRRPLDTDQITADSRLVEAGPRPAVGTSAICSEDSRAGIDRVAQSWRSRKERP